MKIILHQFRSCGLWFAVFFGLTIFQLSAAIYTVTDLGALTNLTGQSQATISAVNLAGKAVGITASNTAYNSFIYGGTRTNLDTLGGPNCYAQGINTSNVICGSSTTVGGVVDHAFRWTLGATTGVAGNVQMRDLGTLGNGNISDALDINPSGQIAGTSTTDNSDNTFHACRFNTNGAITDVGALLPGGLVQSFGYGINQSGQVVGSAYDQFFSTPEGYFYNGNNVIMLGDLNASPGAKNSEAFAINGNGQIVGYALFGGTLGTDAHAFRWSASGTNGVSSNIRMIDLGTLGGTQSSAWSINNSNVIVGRSNLAGDLEERAFIAVSNTMVNLNTQLDASSNSWLLIKAEYINDAGQIVGYGTNNGTLHGFLLTVPAPGVAPVITNQPSPLAIIVSNNATFTVGASGTAPLAYQWRLNTTTNIFGATNFSFTITNAQATNVGNYTVVITNNFGSITSSPAALTVNFPPSIGTPPASQTVLVGSNAAFTVAAGGTAPLVYQWKFTANLAGATNVSLTITNAQTANAGNYSVSVTNNFGSVTSSPAVLNVVTAPQITTISVVNSNVLLGFTTSAGATYFVEGRTNLAAGSWLNAVTNIAGSGGTKNVIHTNGALPAAQLYRVRVTVP